MINTPEVANQVANHCNLHNLVHRLECVGLTAAPWPSRSLSNAVWRGST